MSRVVVTGRIPAAAIQLLDEAGHEVVAHTAGTPIGRAELLAMVAGADALLTLLTERVDDELLKASGPQLQVACNVAVGYNNIDVAACAARNVIATNTPGVLTDATADIAMGLILMVTRRLAEGERLIRSRQPWQWGMFMMLGTGIQHLRLGIIGMGQIGTAVARRAKAFGMTIAYSNRSEVAPAIADELEASYLTVDDLLASCDVVSLHCPYSSATHHFMNAARFAQMKPTAFIINTARGPVVDEAALVEALRAGQISGAGLDVFENEPAIHEGLLDRDDVVLLPHLGSATMQTRTAMATLAARNAIAVLAGNPPISRIG